VKKPQKHLPGTLEKGPRTTLGLIPTPSKRLNLGYVGIYPFRSSGRSIPNGKRIQHYNLNLMCKKFNEC